MSSVGVRVLTTTSLTLAALSVPVCQFVQLLTFEPPVFGYQYQDATISMTVSAVVLAVCGAATLLLARSTRAWWPLWGWWLLLLLSAAAETAHVRGRVAGAPRDTAIVPDHVDVSGAVELGLLVPTLWPLYLCLVVTAAVAARRALRGRSRPAPRSPRARSSAPAPPPYGG